MQNYSLEEITAKHLRLILEELSDKNITGARFVKQKNKIMLLFDKTLLSRTNQQILNAINTVYPNTVVSINDIENPFDYKGLYDLDSEKPNKKVRPCTSYLYSIESQNNIIDYFDRFRFTGIELDTEAIPIKNTQFGFLLEFINALQEQDIIQYENSDVLDENAIKHQEHYIKNGRPDKNHLDLWIHYNEELIEYSNGLKISNDPYLSRDCRIILNKGVGKINTPYINITLERINQNVQNYLKRKFQDNEENQRQKHIITNTKNSLPLIEDDIEL